MAYDFLKTAVREQKMLSWAVVILLVASLIGLFVSASYVAVEKSYEPA